MESEQDALEPASSPVCPSFSRVVVGLEAEGDGEELGIWWQVPFFFVTVKHRGMSPFYEHHLKVFEPR